MNIRLDRISHRYSEGMFSLRDVDIELRRGECVGVVGENGSGKSTLGRILAGLLKPTSGSVDVNWRTPPTILYTAQNPDYQLFAETVEREIQYGLELRRAAKNSIGKIVEYYGQLLGLRPYFNCRPLELSYGLRKLLVIAAAMTLEPDILVIDEGTVGLDRSGLRRLDIAIWRMRKRGASTVLISHDTEFVARHCERIVFLEGGQKQFDGPSASFVRFLKDTNQRVLELPVASRIADAFNEEEEVYLTVDRIAERIARRMVENERI